MKRILMLLFTLLLLTGCARKELQPLESILPTRKQEVSWVERTGKSWDREGRLLEIPMVFPEGIHYGSVMEYDGDLLFWSIDSHLADSVVMELTVLELDDGLVTAQKDISMIGYLVPQVLGDKLYLCDNVGGTVLELDKKLNEINRWTLTPTEGIWYMGANNALFWHDLDSRIHVTDLASGQTQEFLPDCGEITVHGLNNGTMTLQYYRKDTGANAYAGLNLLTGEVIHREVSYGYDSVNIVGDRCLSTKYNEHYSYRLSVGDSETVEVIAPQYYLQLMNDGNILATSEDGMYLHIFSGQGKAIASCQISENSNYYTQIPIWNEANGGYFLLIVGYDDNQRLLFLDSKQNADVENLSFATLPVPSEKEKMIQTRCEELSIRYGVNILYGEQCDTEFYDYTATIAKDHDQILAAIDLLEDALDDYPENFFRQVRHDSIRTINIQLVCNLQATGDDRKNNDYFAFTQEMWDHYLIVADIDDVNVEGLYHEFSHVIDSFLEWDSTQRPNALYSEQGWLDLNPKWFNGYSYDYSVWPDVEDYTYFIDSYSLISPTEDRARVMENAMSEHGYWAFINAPGLQNKLSYYSRCIRDAFDTTGWPDTLRWERYLN